MKNLLTDKKFWIMVILWILIGIAIYYGWTQYLLKYPDANFF